MTKWLSSIISCVLLGMPLQVLAQEAQLMPVPAQTIYPGQSLDAAEFVMKLFNVPDSSRTTYVFAKEQVSGKEAIRTLAMGKPIALRSIRTLEDVKKGVPTKAIYSAGSIEIQGLLVPLSGGTIGQTVEARNTTSGGIVKALIVTGGSLLVVGK
jgi:flagellar basal body P-ring formation protein FlgA